MVRAEKYIRFSQVAEGFWGLLSSLRRGFIVNSLQFIVYRLLVTIYSLQIIVNWGVIC
jgi:hypothetical protein